MDVLLDTHVFLWWDQDRPDLGEPARALIRDAGNRVFVSAASVGEIPIQRRRGKLVFDGSATEAIARNGFLEAPIRAVDAEAAGLLAWERSDPFDRLLVAQARGAGMTFITADAAVLACGLTASFAARAR